MAKRFKRYNNLLIKASRYIYSTPKDKAKEVKIATNKAERSDNISKQKIKCESMRSKQKNHFPKSMK